MNSHTDNLADNLIDQTLRALRDTDVPDGLEARIAARLAQSADVGSLHVSRLAITDDSAAISFFAVTLNAVKNPRVLFAEQPLYAWATIAFILTFAALSTNFLLRRHTQTTIQSNSTSTETYTATRESFPPQTSTPNSIAKNHPARNFPLRPQNAATQSELPPSTPTDPDAIALAETQAPSRPAPTAPLTAQEVLLIRATRRGQPIEVAELDIARGTALRSISQARQRASLRQYIQSLLGPLATAEALTPTSPSSADAPETAAATDPPSSK